MTEKMQVSSALPFKNLERDVASSIVDLVGHDSLAASSEGIRLQGRHGGFKQRKLL